MMPKNIEIMGCKWYYFILAALITQSCNRPRQYDLIVENARLFDVYTGNVIDHKIILISGDTIAGIVDAGEPVRTKKVVDADGRLVTPANIDTHTHITDVLESDGKTPRFHPKILNLLYRKKISENYLPYGTTTIIDMGMPDDWVRQALQWAKRPLSRYTDVIVSGSNIIEEGIENHTLYDLVVNDTRIIELKLEEYQESGVRNVVVDYRLHPNMFTQVCAQAQQLGLKPFAHLYRDVPFRQALDAGVNDFEFIHTIATNSFDFERDKPELDNQLRNIYGEDYKPSPSVYILEMFKYLAENRPVVLDSTISMLAKHRVSFSTSLHNLAETCDLTHFRNIDDKLTREQVRRNAYSFTHFLKYVKKAHDAGIMLRIGTNCRNGGMALLSEQLLLFEAGIPIADIIKISTINGAIALGIDNKLGAIEVGKRANLIVYDQNPFDNPRNFLSPRKVIKNGKLYKKELPSMNPDSNNISDTIE